MFGAAEDDGDDTLLVASVKVDDGEMAELLGPDYTDDDVKREIWKEIDKINAEAPMHRKIKKEKKKKTDFIHNTSSKLMRMVEENKLPE